MGYKILHIADLHLDTPFLEDGMSLEFNNWRRSSLWSTLTRVLNLAREKQVNAITIAGDLYEQNYSLPKTASFLAEEFGRINPIRIIISPGEHDPFTSESFYSFTNWPENVDIFYQPKLASLELSKNIHIWGASYPVSRGSQLFNNFRISNLGLNILLLHAIDKQNSKAVDLNHYIFDSKQAQDAGFRIALLGHEHKGYFAPEDKPFYFYPGSPEPFSLAEETFNHQAILLDIDEVDIKFETYNLRTWHYSVLHIDVTTIDSLEKLIKGIERQISSQKVQNSEKDILIIQLTGILAFPLDSVELSNQFSSRCHARFDMQFQSGYEFEILEKERTIRGLLVQRLRNKLATSQDPDERKQIKLALNIALRALDGKGVNSYETD